MADRIEDGGPAFPRPDWNGSWEGPDTFSGMSLRDWFAGQALAGLCGNSGGPYQQNTSCGWGLVNCTALDVAHEAYALADAMLSARQKGGA